MPTLSSPAASGPPLARRKPGLSYSLAPSRYTSFMKGRLDDFTPMTEKAFTALCRKLPNREKYFAACRMVLVEGEPVSQAALANGLKRPMMYVVLRDFGFSTAKKGPRKNAESAAESFSKRLRAMKGRRITINVDGRRLKKLDELIARGFAHSYSAALRIMIDATPL